MYITKVPPLPSFNARYLGSYYMHLYNKFKNIKFILIIVRQLVQPAPADLSDLNFIFFDLFIDDDIILVSPVHPVAEGHPVTLSCKLKTEKVLHDVDFYKNDKLIRYHTNGELIISAVSKSDEGFYKCKGKESPPGWRSWTSRESWMSVKYVPASGPEKSSPFPVLLIVGLVCGVLLIILLLLFLYRYRKSKDSCFKRSQSTNQGPATDHMINQDETQSRVYASLLHGDLCLYETIQGAEEPENGENNEPEERVYTNVTTRSAADICMDKTNGNRWQHEKPHPCLNTNLQLLCNYCLHFCFPIGQYFVQLT
ncbi:uncharacterized protein LOC119481376 isoform X1 [Sebastes umbrosus]|uniref:uncharacterized protein LOC119481376 isoform X1 n=1 Tax=Sebastes umbrosus TaxID=72105 RepID=UPI00189CF467|nr:uncharacterized protein LOC119481376 isoform X1 [Sebastes umbrosus]